MPNYTKNQLQCMINGYRQQVYYLQKDLENYDSLQREKCCECEHRAVQKYIDLELETECFRDSYFKGLEFKDIAELAKKSLRLTDDNNQKRHLLDDICELLNCEENEITEKIKKLLTNS